VIQLRTIPHSRRPMTFCRRVVGKRAPAPIVEFNKKRMPRHGRRADGHTRMDDKTAAGDRVRLMQFRGDWYAPTSTRLCDASTR
jgi:hypothetical protein